VVAVGALCVVAAASGHHGDGFRGRPRRSSGGPVVLVYFLFLFFNILCREPPVFTINVCHELEWWHTTNTAFAVKMFAMRDLLRATHCKLFAVSKPGFAVSIELTAKL
jgi:hypothetical protein